jgi:hypothetical protein
MLLQDTTDYQFATATRRLLVRQAPKGELVEAARRHAEQLPDMLAATEVHTSEPMTTANRARAVVVTASLPPDEASSDRTARVVRTGFLQFPAGPLVELTLHALATDATADAEFRRLLDSVRPTAVGPLDGVAQSLAAGPTGHTDYPAGAVRLDLTSEYHTPTIFALASPDGGQRYYLERAAAAQDTTKTAVVGSILGSGVAVARSENGRPIRYEAGPRPRLSPGRTAPPAAADPFGLVKGAAIQDGISGNVRGVPVRVRVVAPATDGNPQELAIQLLRDLNPQP